MQQAKGAQSWCNGPPPASARASIMLDKHSGKIPAKHINKTVASIGTSALALPLCCSVPATSSLSCVPSSTEAACSVTAHQQHRLII